MPSEQSLLNQWELWTATIALLGPVLTAATLAWVLNSKRDATSAVAWCLVVLFLPFFGPVFFFFFGYQHVSRPLKRKRRHRRIYRLKEKKYEAQLQKWQRKWEQTESPALAGDSPWRELGQLAQRLGGFPISHGNRVRLFHDGASAFEAMEEAIERATHHIHLEKFIIEPDETGRRFLDLLASKAQQGVEVRVLYDAMGSRNLNRRMIAGFTQSGGSCSAFLPLNPMRRRIQVNMRNHRKILVVDGKKALTGGLNLGDEYLGLVPAYGHWRDTHMELEGPCVAGLQSIFVEDWDFASGETLSQENYFPAPDRNGEAVVQVVDSGPDEETKCIREVLFAGIQRAKKSIWIASPYFVPDAGLLDALRLASYLGRDVRILGLRFPDHWIPYFAGRYYWTDLLRAGARVYQYAGGMMHAKILIIDGEWATVGTANFDNRSLHLNFEVNCLIYSQPEIHELCQQFERDLADSVLLEERVFTNRPLASHFMDNACRLLSPIL